MNAKVRGWRRLLQVRLGTLFLLVTACCAAMGWRQSLVISYQKQHEAAKRLTASGASLKLEPANPAWLRRFMDEQTFQDVIEVRFESKWKKGEEFEPIKDLPNVKRLYIANNLIDDRVMYHLRNCHRLERISLWQTSVTDYGMQYLANKKHLRAVDLHSTRVSDDGVRHLARATKMNKLKLPDRVTNAGLQHLRGLTELRELHLTGSEITAKGIANFKDAKITRLHIDYIGGERDDLKYMCQLRFLQELNLRDLQVNPQYFHLLGAMPQLQTLRVRSTFADDELVRQLQACPRLESLQLTATRITASGIEMLANFPRLQTLYLQSALITSDDVAPLVESPKFTSLRIQSPWFTAEDVSKHPRKMGLAFGQEGEMHLSRMEGSGPPFLRGDELRSITRRRNLAKLVLAGCYANDCDLTPLEKLPHLRELHLSRGYTSRGVGDETLRRVARLQHTEKMVVASFNATVAGLSALAKMPELQELRIIHPFLTIDDKQLLRKAFDPPIYIEFVAHKFDRLAGQPVRDEDVEKMARIDWINRLDLSHTQITDAGLLHLAKLKKLRYLVLTNTPITGAGIVHLRDLPVLEELRLTDTVIADKHLAMLPKRSLRSLSLGGTNVTDAGLRHLSGMSKLTYLRLGGNSRQPSSIVGPGLQTLSQLPALKVLNLSHTTIRDQDLTLIATCAKLDVLHLEDTHITDVGVRILATFPALKHVTLTGSRVTLAGAKQLASAKSLESVSVAFTRIRREQLEELQECLPNVKIHGL